MWVTKDLFNIIDNCTGLSGNTVFLTDLENVLHIGNCLSPENINIPISRTLLQKFLDFSYTDIESTYFLINDKENIVPIYEEKCLNTNWSAQIILPIYIDDSLYGSLISVNYHKNFNEKHLEFARTTQNIVKKYILKSLSEEWRKEHEEDE